MKHALPWLLLVVFAALVWKRDGRKDAALQEQRALVASRDSVIAAQKAHEDSSSSRLARADVRATVVTRLVEVTRIDSSLSDSLHRTATTLDEMREAWTVERRVSDTLRVALVQSRRESDDVRVALAFMTLQSDGWKRRAGDAETVAANLAVALKPRFRDRLGLNVGYGTMVSGGRVYAGPSVIASYRVWP